MPADEVRHETPAGESRARTTGGRHAAPRKPLFTRLHMPAGKAIAIAAMPTAVLMGMGLTPSLASAKPLPNNPFRDGPCVSVPDEPSKDAAAGEKEAAAKEKAAKEAKEKAEKEKAAEDEAAGDGAKDDAGGKNDQGGKGDQGGQGGKGGKGTDKSSPKPASSSSPDASSSPEPAPEESKKRNPLDPLGLGDVLGGLFGGGKSDDDAADAADDGGDNAAGSPAPDASPSASGSKGGSGLGKVTKPVTDTVDKVTGKAEDTVDDTADGLKDATGEAKDAAKATDDPMAPDEDGKKPFPCVEEEKVAGDAEKPPAQIPNQPWYLEASSLLLKGLDYKGVVNLTMPNGRTKQALKFVADDGIDIGDLHQIVDGPGGKKYHVQAAPGSTSTIRDGQVTLYTERLQGNLFGLIPIVFDPEHPPPLNIPIAYFTKVKITQAGQFGGNLTIPGLHQSITD